MGKIYTPKPKRYTKEDLEAALRDIREKKISIRQAQKMYKYVTKNDQKMYKYVSIIQKVTEENDFEVMTLKSVDDTKTRFRTIESDVNIVTFNDIIKKLPLPQLVLKGTRVHYIFPIPPDIYEN